MVDEMFLSFFTGITQQENKTIKQASPVKCGSDHKLLIAKFRFKLKKVGKITRPFRYDLNQISYDYTMEVTNRFKGLDLMTEHGALWRTVRNIVQKVVIKTILKKNKCKKAKWLSEEVLQIAEKKRSKRQRRKRKISPTECRVPKKSTER